MTREYDSLPLRVVRTGKIVWDKPMQNYSADALTTLVTTDLQLTGQKAEIAQKAMAAALDSWPTLGMQSGTGWNRHAVKREQKRLRKEHEKAVKSQVRHAYGDPMTFTILFWLIEWVVWHVLDWLWKRYNNDSGFAKAMDGRAPDTLPMTAAAAITPGEAGFLLWVTNTFEFVLRPISRWFDRAGK